MKDTTFQRIVGALIVAALLLLAIVTSSCAGAKFSNCPAYAQNELRKFSESAQHINNLKDTVSECELNERLAFQKKALENVMITTSQLCRP